MAAKKSDNLTPQVDPRKLAVPEREERLQVKQTVVMPEVEDQDEEQLIDRPARVGKQLVRLESHKFENVFLLLLFIFGSLTVVFSGQHVGMSWDEAYYLEAGGRTLEWMGAFWDGNESATGEKALEYYWNTFTREPKGHPPLTRYLVAAGLVFAPDAGSPLPAMRFPIALCYGLSLAVLYLLVRLAAGRVSAWMAVLAYFLMPRVFGHAHFAATETPMVLMTLLCVYAFLRGLHSRNWSVLFGIFIGLAFATKINALLIPVILVPWAFLYERRASVFNLFSMLLLAPLTLVVVWPWLWSDTLLHFAQHLLWNFGREQMGLFYFGRFYGPGGPPVPGIYPLHLVAFTLPVITLVLMIFGLARVLRTFRQQPMGILLLWAAAVPLLVQSASFSPKYDGVRLFLTAFPFLAALAGIGGAVIVRMAAYYENAKQRMPRGQLALIVLILALTVNGGLALMQANPYFLSWFNSLAGGREGVRNEMALTYWGEVLNRSAADQINEVVPDGARLTPRAMNAEVLHYYQKWGWIKPTIRIVDTPGDYLLLQYRPGLYGEADKLLLEMFKGEPVEFGPQETPLMGLYRTGPDFKSAWSQRVRSRP